MRIKSDHAQKTQTHNIAWHRISDKMISQFQDKVNKSVQRVPQHLYLCLNCKDTNCQSHGHKQALDKLCDHMENMLVNNAMLCFPKTKKRHALPYWNEKVQPLKNESIFWHWMWRECGQPATGVVTDTYKRCKRKYHAAIKDLKRQQNELRNARMAESIARNNSRDLWKELNKMKPRCKVIPPQVDGNADNKSVCKLFAQKYETLLNSVPADEGKLAQIKSNLADRLSRIESSFIVTVDHIRDAVQKLKVNKSDGNKGLISDMIIKAPLSWLQLLAKLVTSMFIHGYCPEVLCKATVTSLVKDPMGDLCDSNNYRGIALSSAINKIIDWLILTRSKESLQTSDLQFAYKANNSTSMCSLALKEVAAYYIQNGGNVFCTMLDASKAFDRLRYDKLFQLLEGRNLDPIIFRFLLCSYEKQLTRTRWLTETSAYFSSENGVRQGGVASPILFTVYMDELIHRLEGSHIGCYIGREFFGTLCYADDVTLLAPTVSALQHMLQVCEDFGKEYDVSYNPSKSICLQIGGEILQTRSDVFLNGQTIKWDNSAKHLGNIINTHNSDSNDIRQKRNDFLARSNSVFVTYRAASREAKTKVFTSKCCCFYGSQTWRLTSREVEELHVTWRKAV